MWSTTSFNGTGGELSGSIEGYCGFGLVGPLLIGKYIIKTSDGNTTEFSDDFSSDQKPLSNRSNRSNRGQSPIFILPWPGTGVSLQSCHDLLVWSFRVVRKEGQK